MCDLDNGDQMLLKVRTVCAYPYLFSGDLL